jgi:hypothetical protein
MSYEIGCLYLCGEVNWKWEASSKNNANTYLVRCGSSASKCIIFLFANWDVSDCFCGKVDAIDLKER